jgi:hypothetical protein
MPHGYGVLFKKEGSIYFGEFKGGDLVYGNMMYRGGFFYEGEIKN